MRRRSSRLSGKMPLLGKDPSDIVSPYFTPKGPVRDEHNDLTSSSPLGAMSPIVGNHENIVVEIPPLGNTNSAVDSQETPTSASPTDDKPLSIKLPSHAKGFTTPHAYFPSLMSLPNHFNSEVEILAVATTASKQPQRAKSGPRDYFTSFRLADSSCDAGDTISVQLFRPYKKALPSCKRGDILLLRGMKVQTRPNLGTRRGSQGRDVVDGMMLLSTEGSAWATFKFRVVDAASTVADKPESTDGTTRLQAKRSPPPKVDIQINGPPIEFGAEERAYARGMHKWWIEEGGQLFPDANSTESPKTRRKGKATKHGELEVVIEGGRLHEHELRDGMAYGDMISPRPLHDHSHHNGPIHHGAEDGSLHEHELRDGMAYGDTISQLPLHEHQHRHTAEQSYLDDSDQQEQDHYTDSEEEHSTLHDHELRDGMAFGDTIRPEALHGHFNTQKDLHHHQNDPHDPPDQTDTQSPSPPEESPSHLRSRQDDLSGSARDAIPSMVGRTTRRRARAAAAQDKENI